MAAARVKTGGELNAPAAAEIVPQFEAALQARTRGSNRPVILRGRVEIVLSGLIDPDLRAQAGLLSKREALLETRLRLPQPKIPVTSQRRYSHLGQRVRLTRRNDRFILPDHKRLVFPIDFE